MCRAFDLPLGIVSALRHVALSLQHLTPSALLALRRLWAQLRFPALRSLRLEGPPPPNEAPFLLDLLIASLPQMLRLQSLELLALGRLPPALLARFPPSLLRLGLSEAPLDVAACPWASLAALRELTLRSVGLRDAPFLAHLPALTALDLRGNPLKAHVLQQAAPLPLHVLHVDLPHLERFWAHVAKLRSTQGDAWGAARAWLAATLVRALLLPCCFSSPPPSSSSTLLIFSPSSSSSPSPRLFSSSSPRSPPSSPSAGGVWRRATRCWASGRGRWRPWSG